MQEFKVNSRVGYLAIAVIVGIVILQARCVAVEKRESLHWSSAPGEIISSYAKEETRHDRNNVTVNTNYLIQIRYEYEVKGLRYTGHRVRIQQPYYPTLGAAEKELTKYPVGTKVEVFYDPTNPRSSALIRN